MTKILQTGWDKQHTKAENLSMNELDDADIWPMDTAHFADRWPSVSLKITTKHSPNDYFQVGSIDVVSDQVKAIMEQIGVEAEFLPVRVVYRGKAFSERSFFFCHILDQVDCFDHQRGQCTFHDSPEFKDHIDEIQKLVIDEDKVAGHHLFRIAKGAEYIVCLSDELAARLSESEVTGMRFVEPEEWK